MDATITDVSTDPTNTDVAMEQNFDMGCFVKSARAKVADNHPEVKGTEVAGLFTKNHEIGSK